MLNHARLHVPPQMPKQLRPFRYPTKPTDAPTNLCEARADPSRRRGRRGSRLSEAEMVPQERHRLAAVLVRRKHIFVVVVVVVVIHGAVDDVVPQEQPDAVERRRLQSLIRRVRE